MARAVFASPPIDLSAQRGRNKLASLYPHPVDDTEAAAARIRAVNPLKFWWKGSLDVTKVPIESYPGGDRGDSILLGAIKCSTNRDSDVSTILRDILTKSRVDYQTTFVPFVIDIQGFDKAHKLMV